MKIKRIIVALSLILSILCSNVAYAAEKDLSSMTFDEIILEMNSDSNNMNERYSLALQEIMKTAPGDRIIEEILNEDNSLELRKLICVYCEYNDLKDLDYEKIVHLLFEEELPYEFKLWILDLVYHYIEYPLEILVDVVRSSNDSLAYRAMDFIMDYRFETASELADEILNGFSGPVGIKQMAAIEVRGEEIRNGGYDEFDGEVFREFLDLCDGFLYDEFEDYPDFAENVMQVLKRLDHYFVGAYVLHCDKFDNSLKMSYVDKYDERWGHVFGHVEKEDFGGIMGNVISAGDALAVLKYAAGLKEFDTFQSFVADVNWDGVIDATDALLLLQKAAGLIEELPVQTAISMYSQFKNND